MVGKIVAYVKNKVEEKFPQRKFSEVERDARRIFVVGPVFGNFRRNLSEIELEMQGKRCQNLKF